MDAMKPLAAMLAAQDWTGAERLLRRLSKNKTAPPEVFYNLAKVLEASGKHGQITTWLKRAVAANPLYASAWFELGRHQLEAGALEDACHAFAKAHRCDPSDPDSKRNLGRVALRLGDWGLAAHCFDDEQDREAQLARYRIAAETGIETVALRDAMLADRKNRISVLKTLTRTAKGSFPLCVKP
jgi:tetratricopeptide (TPR) repeat protein